MAVESLMGGGLVWQMPAGWIIQLLGYVAVAGAVYGGIRADLRNIRWRLDRLEKEADMAHERIDQCQQDCGWRRRKVDRPPESRGILNAWGLLGKDSGKHEAGGGLEP